MKHSECRLPFGPRLVASLLGGGIVLAAWTVIPVPSLGFDLPKVSVLAFFGALAGCVLLLQREPLPAAMLSWPGRLAMLFFCLVFVSVLWSVAPLLSVVGAPPRFEGILLFGVYALYFLGGAVAVRDAAALRTLITLLIVAIVGVVLYGLLQALHLDPLGRFWQSDLFLGRVFSTIGQPNALGLFLLLTLPFVIDRSRKSVSGKRTWWVVVFLFSVIVLLAAASRSAIFGLAAAIALAFGWRDAPRKRSSAITVGVVVLIAVFLVALGAAYLDRRFERETSGGRSSDARIVLWAAGVDMVRMRPLGYGPETTGLVAGRFIGSALLPYESLLTRIDRLHSQPLDILVTAGPAALIAYGAFMIAMLLSLWKRRAQGCGHDRACMMALAGSGIALLVGFHVPLTGALFWLVAGIALPTAETPSQASVRAVAALAGRLMVLACVVLAIVLAVVSVPWIRARVQMDRADRALSAGNLDDAVRAAAQSVDHFGWDRDLLVRAAETNLLALEQPLDAVATTLLHERTNILLARLDRLTGGEDGMAMLLHAWQEALGGRRESAESWLMQAALRQPDAVSVYRIGEHVYALLGDASAARNVRDRLRATLPLWWDDPALEPGRIMRKENPWLVDMMTAD